MGPITHASDTARSIELNITASRPVRSACSRARANICGLAVEPKRSGTPQQTAERNSCVPGNKYAGENAQQTAKNNQAFAIAFFCRNARPETG